MPPISGSSGSRPSPSILSLSHHAFARKRTMRVRTVKRLQLGEDAECVCATIVTRCVVVSMEDRVQISGSRGPLPYVEFHVGSRP